MTECVVVLIVQSCEVVGICIWIFVDSQHLHDLLKLGWDHELHVLTLELLEEAKHEWYEELFHQQLSWVVGLLYCLALGIFSRLCVMLIKVGLWVDLIHCFDHIVKLLQLSTNGSEELVGGCSFVTSINI